jgi:hypothetical protein
MTKPKKYWKKENWKKATGRPTVFTEDVIEKLEQIFRIDWTVSEACNYADIDQSTYHLQMNSNPKFFKKMSQAQEYPFILARKWLFKNVQKEDMRAIETFLKRRDWRYKDKVEVEQDWNLNVNIKEMTNEELDEMIKKSLAK